MLICAFVRQALGWVWVFRMYVCMYSLFYAYGAVVCVVYATFSDPGSPPPRSAHGQAGLYSPPCLSTRQASSPLGTGTGTGIGMSNENGEVRVQWLFSRCCARIVGTGDDAITYLM